MIWLATGLLLFLGLHSIRRIAPEWRQTRIRSMGDGPWRAAYSLLSIGAFVLLVWGYGQAAGDGARLLWTPPLELRHVAILLVLVAFVLVVAAYIPSNHLKSRIGHPMLLGVAVWSFAHLIATASLRDVLLFGSFLAWSALVFRSAFRSEPPTRRGGRLERTVLVVLLGFAAWAGFAHYLHLRWIGVSPLG